MKTTFDRSRLPTTDRHRAWQAAACAIRPQVGWAAAKRNENPLDQAVMPQSKASGSP